MTARHFDTEDGPELAAGDHVSGWNGSRTLYVPERRQPGPLPDGIRARLMALRDEAAKRAELQRKLGLIA